MTLNRFKQLWNKAGLNNPPKFDKPIMVDEMSDHTIDALLKAAKGDFTVFEDAKAFLEFSKGMNPDMRDPQKTHQYFKKRFAETAK